MNMELSYTLTRHFHLTAAVDDDDEDDDKDDDGIPCLFWLDMLTVLAAFCSDLSVDSLRL